MTLSFSEIKQEKQNYLIEHGIETFNYSSSESRLVTKHGILYSIIIELKLMADGSIYYILKPTGQFLEAFKQYAGKTTLGIRDNIGAVAVDIKAIHKKYDELESSENVKNCTTCKYEDHLASEEPCCRCSHHKCYKPKETNKQEAKVANMRDLRIKKVIFNKPYTIVLWKDGSKTMIKCGENDVYDKEKGLALCIAKKTYGNKYGWYDIFQKYIPELKEAKKDVKE